jgi:hypothetical protein
MRDVDYDGHKLETVKNEFVQTFMSYLGFDVNFVKILDTEAFFNNITRDMIIRHLPEADLSTPYTDVRSNHGWESASWQLNKINKFDKSELIELFMSVLEIKGIKTWKDGTWKDGTWRNGTWENGTWENGTWQKGLWLNGLWCNGLWKNGTWENGTWKDGLWQDGLWQDGTWEGGYWKSGWIYDPHKKGNYQPDWRWKGDYVHSPINPKDYFKKEN